MKLNQFIAQFHENKKNFYVSIMKSILFAYYLSGLFMKFRINSFTCFYERLLNPFSTMLFPVSVFIKIKSWRCPSLVCLRCSYFFTCPTWNQYFLYVSYIFAYYLTCLFMKFIVNSFTCFYERLLNPFSTMLCPVSTFIKIKWRCLSLCCPRLHRAFEHIFLVIGSFFKVFSCSRS
jgi:hypothetical protein